jgi:dihydrofolate reductase
VLATNRRVAVSSFFYAARFDESRRAEAMGRLKLQMQITIDGFNPDGPGDDLAWDEVRDYSRDLLDSVDTIVIGRKTAVDFIPHWENAATKPDDSWHEVARRIAEARKIVFSRTLDKCDWSNTAIAKGNLVEEIQRLKTTNAKDIIVYGGISFVSSLIKENLIDEFHLFVNPVAIGKGESVFGGLENSLRLALKKTITCNSGHVLLNYELKRQ